MPAADPSPAQFPRWVLVGAILIPCLYLPTLGTRFDFNDDGLLVYPSASFSWRSFPGRMLEDAGDEFRSHGPYRPVTLAHWAAAAQLMGDHPLYRRLARLAWCMLSTGVLLWLLHELAFLPSVALATAALAMWNPYRNEIWLGLGLTEAFGMPYGLAGLICAIRASRSATPWRWEVAAATFALLAIGCKNTFAAVVPAQVLLRLTAGEGFATEGRNRRVVGAALLALPLIFPAVHFLLFKLHPSPNHYPTGFTWEQPWRMCRSVLGAMSIDFMGPALGLMLVTLAIYRWRLQFSQFQARYRPAALAAAALLVCGIAMYLPINGVSGRYMIPSVWGADLALAVLLSAIAAVPANVLKRTAYAAFACGLLAVAVANLGKQSKCAARAEFLWQALEYVEDHSPTRATVAWDGHNWYENRPGLDVAEGVHFEWHLKHRGRDDIRIEPRTANADSPRFVLSCSPPPPSGDTWRLARDFTASYWLGRRCFHCYLWSR